MTKRSNRLVALAALMLAVAPGTALAQRLTGTLKGTVTDTTGGILPGVIVTINSPALITPNLAQTTTERGEFRFPGLEPGVYEIKAELMGFGSVVRQNVRVAVGATANVVVQLQPELGETIVVTTAGPTVDVESTKSGVNFTKDLLRNIPSDRSLNAVFNFAPGVTGDSTRGSAVRGNAYQYDGVDISDPTVGTPFVFFNYDNFEEVQVQTGGHPAEYGQASGAVINVVTKSGGNAFSGEGNFYFKTEGMTSTNGQDITESFPDLESPKLFHEYDAQGQVGGPIARDRIWFFTSYRYVELKDRAVGFNDPAGEPIPVNTTNDYWFGKLTAQLNADHKIVGGLNYDTIERDNRGANSTTPPESTRFQDSVSWTPNVEWTGIFSQNTFAQVRFTAVDSDFDLIPKNNQPRCQNLDTGIAGCSDGREDLNRRDRKQMTASLSHYRELGGSHDFKFGFEYEDSDELRDFTANQGLWSYTVLDGAGNEIPYLSWTIQDPPNKAAIDRISFYAQDTWVIEDRLTLNLGLRVDSYEGWLPEQELPDGSTQADIRDVFNTTDLSPRVGAAYDISGNGKSVVRASYSRFVDALITENFKSVNQNAISGQLRAACDGPLGFLCAPGDGDLSSAVLSEFGAGNTLIDPDLDLGKTDEYSIGFEQEVMPNLSFGVNYVEKNEFDLIEDVVDRVWIARTAHSDGDTEFNEKGEQVGEVPAQTFTVFDPDLDSEETRTITNPVLAERDYRGVEFVVNKRMSDNWQLLGSFTISKAAGLVGTDFGDSSSISGLFDDPNSLINAEGRTSLNRTYQLKLQGTYQMPYGINLSGYYRMLSGRPYTNTVRFTGFDSNGDGVNDTPFDGGSITINAETRGARDLDSLHLLDLRVEKEFALPYGRVGLVFDAFNLFNIDTVTNKRTRTTSAGRFGEPLNFQGPRELRLAARYIF